MSLITVGGGQTIKSTGCSYPVYKLQIANLDQNNIPKTHYSAKSVNQNQCVAAMAAFFRNLYIQFIYTSSELCTMKG